MTLAGTNSGNCIAARALVLQMKAREKRHVLRRAETAPRNPAALANLYRRKRAARFSVVDCALLASQNAQPVTARLGARESGSARSLRFGAETVCTTHRLAPAEARGDTTHAGAASSAGRRGAGALPLRPRAKGTCRRFSLLCVSALSRATTGASAATRPANALAHPQSLWWQWAAARATSERASAGGACKLTATAPPQAIRDPSHPRMTARRDARAARARAGGSRDAAARESSETHTPSRARASPGFRIEPSTSAAANVCVCETRSTTAVCCTPKQARRDKQTGRRRGDCCARARARAVRQLTHALTILAPTRTQRWWTGCVHAPAALLSRHTTG
eukprot:CAMPEP_0170133032 /NCGR_PEP_ID=MMETSP0033_2-20121228/1022_1 /TAXON_ID=195969 /ORGANISM="Dolichomastix tenuilepis, Strain CCMP3274" /LENGTH=335 /DNA_ID=CAMNT_0010368487 /DNA_START=14 /DNA_END=1020 /DNA_ORIENTATION=+